MHKILLIIISSLFLSGCTAKNLFVKKPAGLDVTTSSPATVYLGDQNLGVTPYSDKNIAPGTYSLRLIPTDTTLSPYETSLTLESGVSIAINRTFGPTAVDSSGYTLSFIPDNSEKAYLSVISDPDISNLTIDGVPTGFTPISKYESTPASHEIVVSTPGFAEQKLQVNLIAGHNLLVNVKLASSLITLTPPPVSTDSAQISTTTPSPAGKPENRITGTPTPSSPSMPKPFVTVSDSVEVKNAGGLNVRSSASSSSDSLGKAKIGEQLKYLGETTSAGWHKIEFESKVGYVSAKYVTLTK